MRALLLISCLIFVSNAHAEYDYESRVRKVENIAKRYPNFIHEHELLVEASGVCGAGNGYYIRKGKVTAVELNWLRLLLRYRFNGTTVQTKSGVRIDFEDSTGEEITSNELARLLADPKFSTWLGKDLGVLLTTMSSARSALAAQSPINLENPADFFTLDVYKNYASKSDMFYKHLENRFKLIAIDNLIDCD